MARKPRKASPVAVPSARTSILALRQRGMSDAAIGRAIGRDSSLIGQIARGKKPGANLAGALNTLDRGGKVTAPERRKNKAGREAAYRGSHTGEVKLSAKALRRALVSADGRGQNVSFTVDWGQLKSLRQASGTSELALVSGSGAMELFSRGDNPKPLIARLDRLAKANPKMTDHELAVAFFERECTRRNTPPGKRIRFSKTDPMFRDLRSVTYHYKPRTRAYVKRGKR